MSAGMAGHQSARATEIQAASTIANELLATLEWEADKQSRPLSQRHKDQLFAALVRVFAAAIGSEGGKRSRRC